jgi:hypothetical protein
MLKRIMSLSLLLVLIAVGLCTNSSGTNKDRAGSQTTGDNWVIINYPRIINTILPSGSSEVDNFPKNVQWLITVRILPPFPDESEFKFSIRKRYDGAEALVIVPDKNSIRAQAGELRKRYPSASVEELSRLVAIRRWTVTDKDCPELQALLREYEQMNISPVVADDLSMDRVTYEFWSQGAWGNSMELVLGGPSSNNSPTKFPLVRWAEKVRRVLQQKCRATV